MKISEIIDSIPIKKASSKDSYSIAIVSKAAASRILLKFHYLKDISKTFKSGYNYGLFKDGIHLVGVCIFTGLPVPELSKGMLGLERSEQDGLFELSRLCLSPDEQREEHNLSSWFVSKAIKQFRKDTKVRAILSYADAGFHSGTIYRASNFDYYGLSSSKKDFWIKGQDGEYTKHSRGPVKDLEGEWRPRNQKHRFLMVFDKTLKVQWEKQQYPKNELPIDNPDINTV